MRAVLLKVEPEWRDDDPGRHAWLLRYGFRPGARTIQPRRTIVVTLNDDEETILARMKSKWRYNIRLSARKGVAVRAAGVEGLGTFHDLMRVTGERDAFGIHSRAYYARALSLFAEHDRVRLLIAYRDDEPLAALMPFAFNGPVLVHVRRFEQQQPGVDAQPPASMAGDAMGAMLWDVRSTICGALRTQSRGRLLMICRGCNASRKGLAVRSCAT